MQKGNSDIKMLRMQALSILQVPHSFHDSDDFAPIPAKLDPYCSTKQQIHNDGEESLEEQEFSFACTDPQGTFISADEIFDNGQIRPIFPALDQSLLFTVANREAASPLRPPLKKLLVEQRNSFRSKPSGVPEEPHYEPSRNMTMVEVEASNEQCKKSNSTGFSNLWRFRRDSKLRSNSGCTDTFVFLNPPMPMKSNEAKVENAPLNLKKGKGGKRKTTSSAHEKLYLVNRMRKEGSKRRSFLPYRPHLLGFFSNVNRLSKNLHPF